MQTLLLDTVTWDLVKDAHGNIAVADVPYAMAQDAASEIKTFQGEDWYDRTYGVPYFIQILGHLPPATILKAALVEAALKVPGATNAVCYLSSTKDRKVTGQVQVSANGVTSSAPFVVNFGAIS